MKIKPDHRFYWSWFVMDTLWMLKDTAAIPPQIVWCAMSIAIFNFIRFIRWDVKETAHVQEVTHRS